AQPRLQGGPALEPLEAAECAEPGLLHDFVGDRSRTDERQRDAVHRGPVGIDQSAERVFVAAAQGREERGLAARGLGTGHRSEATCSRGCNETTGSGDCRSMAIRQSLARAWRTDLPREVLLLQTGNALNWSGYGLILPFEIIYLHQFRGF